jgi:hypothetical protein
MALVLRPARGEVHEGLHRSQLVCDAAGTGRIGVERWQPGMRLEGSVSLSRSGSWTLSPDFLRFAPRRLSDTWSSRDWKGGDGKTVIVVMMMMRRRKDEMQDKTDEVSRKRRNSEMALGSAAKFLPRQGCLGQVG